MGRQDGRKRERYFERNEVILSIPEEFFAREFVVGDLNLETPVRLGHHGLFSRRQIFSHGQNSSGITRISPVTRTKEGIEREGMGMYVLLQTRVVSPGRPWTQSTLTPSGQIDEMTQSRKLLATGRLHRERKIKTFANRSLAFSLEAQTLDPPLESSSGAAIDALDTIRRDGVVAVVVEIGGIRGFADDEEGTDTGGSGAVSG